MDSVAGNKDPQALGTLAVEMTRKGVSMPKDVHVVAERYRTHHWILVFDDMNRSEITRQLEIWSIDPDCPLTGQEAERMMHSVSAAPAMNPGEPPELLRGGLGALEV